MKWKIFNIILIVGLISSAYCDNEDCKDDKVVVSLQYEVQNDQLNQDSSTSDEKFVAVQVDHRNQQHLDPNLPRLQDIVLKFLPADKTFVRILNATREIVRGVKFTITFVMREDVTEEDENETYCEIVVVEKPWLIRDNQKFSEMTSNNCSLPTLTTNDRFHYVVNKVFVNQKTDPINVDDQVVNATTEATSLSLEHEEESTTEITTSPTLNGNSMNFLDNFFNVNNFISPTTVATDKVVVDDEVIQSRTNEQSQLNNNNENNNNSSDLSKTTRENLEIEIKKAFSELFQTNAEFQAKIIALIHRRDDSQLEENSQIIINILTNHLKAKFENPDESLRSKRSSRWNILDITHEALDTLDHIDPDDNKRMLLHIIKVNEEEKGDKNLLRIEVEIANSECQENSHEISECEEKIDSKTKKICLLEVNENNGELTGSRCQPREKRQLGLPGGVVPLDTNHENVQLYLKEALVEINKGDGPEFTVKQVFNATTQVVAGSLVKFVAVLSFGSNDITCEFAVWEQPWLSDGRDVQINCNDARTFQFKQTPLNQRVKNQNQQFTAFTNEHQPTPNENQFPTNENQPATNENQRYKRDTIVGGPQEIEKDDKDALELLSNHLSRLDTGSENPLTLVSVEKITRKVVAGLSYEILGNFKAADEEKKCKVTIWHRPWIQTAEGTQIEAKCDDGVRFKQRSKRSVRPLPERLHRHEDGHHHDHDHASEVKSDVLFKQFQQKYNRRYANELEKNTRLRIFKKNLHKIDMLNRHEQGTAKYGLTPFADMTEKEYLHKTGLLIRENRDNELRNPIAEIPDIDLPDEFDWVEKGAVTDVKNQGNCGSCWSFSVTGNVEGLHAVRTGKLESYSEQELLDCDTTDNACNGGYMDDAFKAIEKIGGLELEDEYPYQAKKNKKCMFNSAKVHVKVKGAVDIPKGDEVAMQKYLVANGPISIGINAAAMQFYKGGVSHPWKILCRKADLDHGVLLVGYGTKSYPLFNKTLPYWKIKNSWGPKWGEQGYYRIYRGDNSCGVAEMASSAILE